MHFFFLGFDLYNADSSILLIKYAKKT